jgi:hypothetical protein
VRYRVEEVERWLDEQQSAHSSTSATGRR